MARMELLDQSEPPDVPSTLPADNSEATSKSNQNLFHIGKYKKKFMSPRQKLAPISQSLDGLPNKRKEVGGHEARESP